MRHCNSLLLILAGLIPAFPEALPAADDPVSQTFAQLDANGDRKLSLDDYLRRPGKPEMQRRDFRLFDFNGDEALSKEEFAAIPGLVPPHLRGPLPDPFDHLLEQAILAMDESHNGWDQRPNATVPSSVFAHNFAQSLGDKIPSEGVRMMLRQCDSNGDGLVSRNEARAFLEHQLGIRGPHGGPLRLPNGRILDWGRYIWNDINLDGKVTFEEFSARYAANSPGAMKNFEIGDRDHDKVLSPEEFMDPAWVHGYNDPVELFRRADTDFDGLLDPKELVAATPQHLQPLAPFMSPAFDDDGDGKLSLDEYRVSMLGNVIAGWSSVRTDSDRNLGLTFDEFVFNKEQFLLLQRLYFFRFDRDGNERLTADEFLFQEKAPNSLYRLAADGSSFELIWRDKTLPNAGSPEISPDGQTIAFDLYPEGKIMQVSTQGGQVQEVCDGLMPTWSADGRFLACSHGGVCILRANGTQRNSFAKGWGAQWSPNGRWIAFTMNGGLWVYEVDRDTNREVLPRGSHPYSSLYYGMTWSPDSRRVAVKATKADGSDIIAVDVTGEQPQFEVLFSTNVSLSHDLAWSPDGKRLLFAMLSPEHNRNLLHQLDLETKGPPTVFPGIDTRLTYLNQSYSRDGQWIVLTAK